MDFDLSGPAPSPEEATLSSSDKTRPILQDGDWVGWSPGGGDDAFEEMVGPYYSKRDEAGRWISGCRAEAKNANDSGIVHGGALMTFADHSLFTIARDHIAGRASVTVTLQAEFLAAAKPGDRLISRGEVVKAGRSLIFLRGLIEADGAPVLSYSGVLKVISPRT